MKAAVANPPDKLSAVIAAASKAELTSDAATYENKMFVKADKTAPNNNVL
ncbi:hypothetical protein NBRC116587_01040 [Pseudoteredinibacter isoporae]